MAVIITGLDVFAFSMRGYFKMYCVQSQGFIFHLPGDQFFKRHKTGEHEVRPYSSLLGGGFRNYKKGISKAL
jgi:hypothetical protein